MRRILRLALFAGILAVIPSLSQVSAGERVTLSPDELRLATIVSLETGDMQQAAAMAEALLKRNPNDHEALLLGSRAYRNSGKPERAKALARRAWDVSENDQQRYAAAVVMAQSLSSGGQRTRAQFWLRRAAEHAPNDRLRQSAIRDFKYVRARNPVSIHLSFGFAPKSNINNGSANSLIDLFGLPDVNLAGAALALSGVEYRSGVSLRYRLIEEAARATDLTFRASHSDYTLSSDAKALAPGAKGRDFAFAGVSVGVTQRFMQLETRREISLSFELGKTWYGRAPYSNFSRLSIGYALPLSRRSRLSLNLMAERTRGPAAPHANLFRARADFSRQLSNRGQLGFSLLLTQSNSSQSSADYREAVARIAYALPKPILGVKTSFGLGLRGRDYPSSPYLITGQRQDREIMADMSLVFEKLEYYGFTPTLTMNARRSESNVGLFDIENAGISLGIRSSF